MNFIFMVQSEVTIEIPKTAFRNTFVGHFYFNCISSPLLWHGQLENKTNKQKNPEQMFQGKCQESGGVLSTPSCHLLACNVAGQPAWVRKSAGVTFHALPCKLF